MILILPNLVGCFPIFLLFDLSAMLHLTSLQILRNVCPYFLWLYCLMVFHHSDHSSVFFTSSFSPFGQQKLEFLMAQSQASFTSSCVQFGA